MNPAAQVCLMGRIWGPGRRCLHCRGGFAPLGVLHSVSQWGFLRLFCWSPVSAWCQNKISYGAWIALRLRVLSFEVQLNLEIFSPLLPEAPSQNSSLLRWPNVLLQKQVLGCQCRSRGRASLQLVPGTPDTHVQKNGAGLCLTS